MGFIDWNEKMSVGVEALDNDHKKIVDAINLLYEAVFKTQDREGIAAVLRDLGLYVEYHFECEERLMRLARFPDYNRHCERHAELVKKLGEIQTKYDKGGEIGASFFDFVSDWLMRHILNEDAKYKEYMVRK